MKAKRQYTAWMCSYVENKKATKTFSTNQEFLNKNSKVSSQYLENKL